MAGEKEGPGGKMRDAMDLDEEMALAMAAARSEVMRRRSGLGLVPAKQGDGLGGALAAEAEDGVSPLGGAKYVACTRDTRACNLTRLAAPQEGPEEHRAPEQPGFPEDGLLQHPGAWRGRHAGQLRSRAGPDRQQPEAE
jgi:hypothetical protein